MQTDMIYVVGPLAEGSGATGEEWRGRTRRGRLMEAIPVQVLAENAREFVQALSQVFRELETKCACFELDEIEVSTVISLSGKLAILGTAEGELSGEGSLKFLFKKAKP